MHVVRFESKDGCVTNEMKSWETGKQSIPFSDSLLGQPYLIIRIENVLIFYFACEVRYLISHSFFSHFFLKFIWWKQNHPADD